MKKNQLKQNKYIALKKNEILNLKTACKLDNCL